MKDEVIFFSVGGRDGSLAGTSWGGERIVAESRPSCLSTGSACQRSSPAGLSGPRKSPGGSSYRRLPFPPIIEHSTPPCCNLTPLHLLGFVDLVAPFRLYQATLVLLLVSCFPWTAFTSVSSPHDLRTYKACPLARLPAWFLKSELQGVPQLTPLTTHGLLSETYFARLSRFAFSSRCWEGGAEARYGRHDG